MDIDVHPALPLPLAHVLRQALSQPPVRVRALALPDGGRVWLKRIERATGRMRLQKGDGAKAFEAERAALHALRDAGLPVAAPLAEGPDYLLLPDLGPTLAGMMDDPATTGAERRTAFAAAGRALADLHRAGFAHGRPALRDLCWNRGDLRMIDLERFRNRRRFAVVRALDVVIFTHSWFARRKGQGAGPELDAALAAYRTAAPPALWQALGRLVGWLRPLAVLSRGVLRLRPGSRDWQAVARTLDYLRAELDRGLDRP